MRGGCFRGSYSRRNFTPSSCEADTSHRYLMSTGWSSEEVRQTDSLSS